MNSLDIFFLILITTSTLYSFIRGLVRQIFSFLAIILGFLGASYAYGFPAGWIQSWIANQTLAQILGFVLLFLLIALVLSLLGKLLSQLVKKMDLSWADRFGGAAFGFLKAIFLIAVVLLVLTAFSPQKNRLLSESKIAPRIMTLTRGLSLLVPEKLQGLYTEKEKELKKYLTPQELALQKGTEKGGKKR